MKIETLTRPDQAFASRAMEDLYRSDMIFGSPIWECIQESLRKSFFTQYEDFGFNLNDLGLDALLNIYISADKTQKKLIRFGLEYIDAHAPSIGGAYVSASINNAKQKLREMDSI